MRGGTQYRGLLAGIARISREEGIRGLYSGLNPTLLALIPNWAVYFSVYERMKTSMSSLSEVDDSAKSSVVVHMMSAAAAGAATAIVTNPLWVVRTRLQTQDMGISMPWSARGKYDGTLQALVRISREEGFAKLYSGLVPSLVGILHVTVQFPMYEYLKSRLSHQEGRGKHSHLSIIDLIAASAISKMVASTLTYPHEVVRSQMHVKGTGPFRGIMETIRFILAKDGLRGMYRGCGVNLIRTVPAAALTFTSFELIAEGLRSFLHKYTENGEA